LPDEVKDPAGKRPALWFQEAEGATGDAQQRFHVDVMVPRDVAKERVAAAIAAGGTLVTDESAPSFWVLADAHGNRTCICTSVDR
ncbi:MAG: VOC family protein, partial [Acidimicrobiia bacterium]|nr:VOC family protein [Acidimicrobiia bacterium]